MKPMILKFSAFGPYAGRECLDFADLQGRNFFLIHGATGAGKTTILDAICYALYGSSSGNLRDGRTMRSDHADRSTATEVEFTFAVGCEVYRVWRSPEQERPKKRGGAGMTVSAADAQLFAMTAAQEKLLSHGYSNVTAAVEALLGFKSSQFRQVVLLPQGDFRRLLLANSAERQEIMQTLFKTELYQQIEENLKTRAAIVKAERQKWADQLAWLLKDQAAEDFAQLEEHARAEEAALAEMRAGAQARKAEQERARQAAADGRRAADQFALLEKATREKGECERLIPQVEQYRGLYEKSEQAAKLADLETQRIAQEKDCRALEAESARSGGAAEQLSARKEQAKAAFIQEEGKEELRRAARKRILELDAYAEQAAAFIAAQEHFTQKRQEAEALTKLCADKESVCRQAGEDVRKALSELEAQTACGGQANALRPELEQAKRLAAKAVEAERLEKESAQAKAQCARLEKDFQKKTEEYDALQTQLLRLQHLFTEGQAAILAQSLEEGSPCPVCGSTDHPRPAAETEILPDEAEIKAAQTALAKAERARRGAQDECSAAKTREDTLAARLQDAKEILAGRRQSAAEFQTLIADLTFKADAAQKAADCLPAARAALEALTAGEEARRAELAQAQQALQSAQGAREAAQAVWQERAAALPEAYRRPAALDAARKEAADLLKNLDEAREKARQSAERLESDWAAAAAAQRAAAENLQRAKQRREELEIRFAERLRQAGFADEAAYGAAKKDDAYRKNLAERIRLFDERIAMARHAAESAAQATEGLSLPDMTLLFKREQDALAAYHQSFAAQKQQETMLKQRREKQKEAAAAVERLAQLDHDYGNVGTLADVANGKNVHGMTFQRFVLKSLLDDVIDSSNMRLKVMTRGRYLLQGTDARARKNSPGGLEVEVFDQYTGFARPVATLSGGETFLASLALALGLADVVQSYSGGIRLDTILVDEGFGTLDPESLDMALRALLDLQKGGRLVGIISHVPELKERIDARLEVSKGKNGSAARFCAG